MTEELKNIFGELPEGGAAGEITEIIAKNEKVRIERIISTGQHSAADFWYEQQENEFVLLVTGRAELEFETGVRELTPGDYMIIPALSRHRVRSTSASEPTIWLAFFY